MIDQSFIAGRESTSNGAILIIADDASRGGWAVGADAGAWVLGLPRGVPTLCPSPQSSSSSIPARSPTQRHAASR